MGLKIGKFLGRITTGVVKSVPSAIAGYATMGPAGAGLALASGTTFGSRQNAQAGAAATPSAFTQPSSRFPGVSGGGQMIQPTYVGGTSLAKTMDKEIYEGAVDLLGRLNLLPRDPNAVVTRVRNVLAKMIRFARATPGLTVLALLTDLGIAAYTASKLVSWYATAGKKHRRVRVTNVKALNRSVRRLEGFRRLACRVEAALGRRAARKSSRRHCFRCRKSPCQCS